MKTVLFIVAMLALPAGLLILFSAKSSIHEIEAFLLFVIFVISLSGAGIMEAVDGVRKEINQG